MTLPAFLRTGKLVTPAMPVFVDNAVETPPPVATTFTAPDGSFRTAAATEGALDSSVSKQWMSRPDDEKFTSLTDLKQAVGARHLASRTIDIAPHHIAVNGDNNDLQLQINDRAVVPSNWSFNQLCNLAKVPTEYLKRIPTGLAAQCLQNGLRERDGDAVKALIRLDDVPSLRAITSPNYGRIWDYEVVDQVMKIAGNGTGDTHWKVPGAIDWSDNNGTTVRYNPHVDITKETTTLYASDRDVYIFLVDDTHPIEIGKLANGEPDLLFRGFIVGNSETGSRTFFISTMLMRGVCQNRNLWGVEGKTEIKMRHSKTAPNRFASEVFPMLATYCMASTVGIVNKVNNAKAAIIARNDEERDSFLQGKVGLSKPVSDAVIERVLLEEQKPMESVWDAVQGMTAYARRLRHQDARLDLEMQAGKLMDKIAA